MVTGHKPPRNKINKNPNNQGRIGTIRIVKILMITVRFILDQSFLDKTISMPAGKPKIGMNRLAMIELTKGKTQFFLFNA